MSSRDYYKGHARTSEAPGTDKSWAGGEAGPYIAIVKNNIDPLRMGRLQVNIPAISKTADPISANLITCEYLSPFYGAKDVKYSIPGSTDYKDGQHSYGFWAVPPDIGTRVLVIFAEGKIEQAFWIGCLQDPVTNHMVPGIAASEKTHDSLDGTFEGADAGFQKDKQSTYGTKNVPSGELNRQNPTGNPALNYDTFNKPIHPMAEVLLKQGLSPDEIRGTTTSSARRETPSNVFGISTPGPKDTESRKEFVGTKDQRAQDFVTRKIGHTFVMDDGDVDGNNQLTRLRTASGHQLLMHDTEGVVYLANGSGKAFIEMDIDGTVSVYSDGGINLRSGQDFNLHSDMNINFHAKGQINFTAETNIGLNAEQAVYVMGDSGIISASQNGVIQNYAKTSITSHTPGQQLHGATGQFHLQGSQVHFNKPMGRPGSGGGRTSISDWGPSWLKADAIGITVTEGLIDIDDNKPLANGKPNKIDNKTTVTDFVTHEPYDRQSSTQRKKTFINQAMDEIKKASPDLSATELKVIKGELLKQKSLSAVASKLGKVVNLNNKIKLPVNNLNKLVTQANKIQKLISDPKSEAINFITGKIASIKSQALSFVKSKFRF